MEYKEIFLKQKMMRKVLISLIPILVYSIWLFGLRVLLLLAVVNIFGMAVEYIVMRNIQKDKAKVSEAVFVTGILYTLTLPPNCPLWVAILGIVFGVLFAKAVFGGFGKNIFNPALVGRCFIYISFPKFMTNDWILPFNKFPGGFVNWQNSIDAITKSTPMMQAKSGIDTPVIDLFLGQISGSLGETSALLILIAAIYLLVTKTASYRIMISCFGSFLSLQTILFLTNTSSVNPLSAIFSGGVMFAFVFMATDPISAPKLKTSHYIYGVLIGFVAVVIREFALFTEGVMFAILIANVFASMIDLKIKTYQSKRAVKA